MNTTSQTNSSFHKPQKVAPLADAITMTQATSQMNKKIEENSKLNPKSTEESNNIHSFEIQEEQL